MPTTTADPEDLLTTSEAAALLQVHIDTVRRWANQGVLRPVRMGGGWRRFRRGDLDAFLKSRTA